jgi:hypothetical protein
MQVNPKELAKLGYIKFDLNTGLAGNGKTVCLISDDEKQLIEGIRSDISGKPGTHCIDGTITAPDGTTRILAANINVLARI